jgi:Protein of unknown function (DUF3341)
MKPKPRPPIYGVVAEFDAPEGLVAAAGKTIAQGYRKVEANSPFPVEGLDEALGLHYSRVPLLTLMGGVIGCIGGFFMQWYSAVKHYPMNIGGRPLNSWPAFIPIAFELTILCAAITAVLGMLALNGLPMPYHPLFNVARFERASRDRFFLCIEATDPQFDRENTKRFLESLNPNGVYEVEH